MTTADSPLMPDFQNLDALLFVVGGPGFPSSEPGPNVHDADDGIANGGHHESSPEDCA